MAKKVRSFRVGKVLAYRRSQVWYLCYHEHGQRRRPRVGSDKEAARQRAAQMPQRRLMDKGLRYVLECCRAMSCRSGRSNSSPRNRSKRFCKPATLGSSRCF